MRLLRQIRDALGDISGRGQVRIIDSLVDHLRISRRAVDVARRAATGELDLDEASERIDDLEGEGDRQRAHLVRSLSQSLVIPIDREDLFRLSRTIDDVLDNLRDFSRELQLFGTEVCSPLFSPVFAAIDDTLDELEHAVGKLASDPRAAMPQGLRAKRSGKEIRRAYQVAIAQLLDAEVTSVLLRRRELLRRLDAVGISIGEATDALADGGLKRGR